jgi:hypothetical protein
LDGKVSLALRDDSLGWIGILDDQITGIARHHDRWHRTLATFADFDHIGDLNEMILHPLAAAETGSAGGLDNGQEIPIIRVAEHPGKVAAGSEFVTRRIGAADLLEGGDFVTHNSSKMLGKQRSLKASVPEAVVAL